MYPIVGYSAKGINDVALNRKIKLQSGQAMIIIYFLLIYSSKKTQIATKI